MQDVTGTISEVARQMPKVVAFWKSKQQILRPKGYRIVEVTEESIENGSFDAMIKSINDMQRKGKLDRNINDGLLGKVLKDAKEVFGKLRGRKWGTWQSFVPRHFKFSDTHADRLIHIYDLFNSYPALLIIQTNGSLIGSRRSYKAVSDYLTKSGCSKFLDKYKQLALEQTWNYLLK